MNANRFFWDSHWLEIWSNHFCPSMGLNGGSVATDSVHLFSLYGRLTVGRTKGCTYMSPPRMRSNAVGGGGGVLYFKLGVGRCSYDASTALPPGLKVGGLEV
jgi:hypothetical protein